VSILLWPVLLAVRKGFAFACCSLCNLQMCPSATRKKSRSCAIFLSRLVVQCGPGRPLVRSRTDSFGTALAPLRDGLGFLPGSACPHYDSEEGRRPIYRQLVASGFPGGFAADDFVGLYFEGTALKEAVTEVDGRCGYSVELVGGEVRETPIPTRYLG